MLSRQRSREVEFSDIPKRMKRTAVTSNSKLSRSRSGRFTKADHVDTCQPMSDAAIDITSTKCDPELRSTEIEPETMQDRVDLLVELKQLPSVGGGAASLNGDVMGATNTSGVYVTKTITLKEGMAPSFDDWVELATMMHVQLKSTGFKYSLLVSSTANSQILKYSTVGDGDQSPMSDTAWINSVRDSIETVMTVSPDELVVQAKDAEMHAEMDPQGAKMDESLDDAAKDIMSAITLLDNPIVVNFGDALKTPGDFDNINTRSLWWDDAPRHVGMISDIEDPSAVRSQRNANLRSFVSDHRPDRSIDHIAHKTDLLKARNLDKEQMDFMITNETMKKQQTTMSRRTDNGMLQSVLASISLHAPETFQPRNNIDLKYGSEYSMNGPPRSLAGVFYA